MSERREDWQITQRETEKMKGRADKRSRFFFTPVLTYVSKKRRARHRHSFSSFLTSIQEARKRKKKGKHGERDEPGVRAKNSRLQSIKQKGPVFEERESDE